MIPLFGLGLTVIFYLALYWGAMGTYLRELLLERGITMPLIVFFTLITLAYSRLAGRSSNLRSPTLIGLFGLSFLPVLLGALGSLNGWTMAWLQLKAATMMMRDSGDISEINEAMTLQIHAMGWLADSTGPLRIGIFSMVITWPVILWLCFRPAREG
ncbi:MAG TPA: hypothetical protein PKE55_00135 [Kiritimatiellia bacterium]|nr:hypothetical protein [Kiritimatiellia bacterium]